MAIHKKVGKMPILEIWEWDKVSVADQPKLIEVSSQMILYNSKISLEEFSLLLLFLTFSLEESFTFSEILDSEIEALKFARRKFSLTGNHSENSEIFLIV